MLQLQEVSAHFSQLRAGPVSPLYLKLTVIFNISINIIVWLEDCVST